jgi:hypothetical protein
VGERRGHDRGRKPKSSNIKFSIDVEPLKCSHVSNKKIDVRRQRLGTVLQGVNSAGDRSPQGVQYTHLTSRSFGGWFLCIYLNTLHRCSVFNVPRGNSEQASLYALLSIFILPRNLQQRGRKDRANGSNVLPRGLCPLVVEPEVLPEPTQRSATCCPRLRVRKMRC